MSLHKGTFVGTNAQGSICIPAPALCVCLQMLLHIEGHCFVLGNVPTSELLQGRHRGGAGAAPEPPVLTSPSASTMEFFRLEKLTQSIPGPP